MFVDPCRAFAYERPTASSSRHVTVGAKQARHGGNSRAGGPAVDREGNLVTQAPSLKGIRALCQQRKLSHSGVHTHGDIIVDHKCRSARVLVETCDLVSRMAAEIELQHQRDMQETVAELARLRLALRDWDSAFGDSNSRSGDAAQSSWSCGSVHRSFLPVDLFDEASAVSLDVPARQPKHLLRVGCKVTPSGLRRELESLRLQVRDLTAENRRLRAERKTAASQLAMVTDCVRGST